jgi:hypothetical protein
MNGKQGAEDTKQEKLQNYAVLLMETHVPTPEDSTMMKGVKRMRMKEEEMIHTEEIIHNAHVFTFWPEDEQVGIPPFGQEISEHQEDVRETRNATLEKEKENDSYENDEKAKLEESRMLKQANCQKKRRIEKLLRWFKNRASSDQSRADEEC